MPKKEKLRIIPLGGVGEIGKNMIVLEYGDDIIVVDCGVMFPDDEMLGIDLVIPDITYLEEHREKVRGIIITHGHEDHTGALPYVWPKLKVPIYASRLTRGLIAVKMKEHKLLDESALRLVTAGETMTLGAFRVEFFHVCHSIPDAMGLAIHTPVGTIVHSGDYKFDQTPVDGKLTDYARLSKLGEDGVLCLLGDSTNTEKAGFTPSESVISENFDHVFTQAPGRVIVATFASNISRIQQVIDAAAKHKRRVGILGRSMIDNVRMALELGYLNLRGTTLLRLDEITKQPPSHVAIVTTGSQGEPTSALTKMANQDYKGLQIIHGDTVIISATAIPGNEESVNHTIDNLFRLGADVVYEKSSQVHVSGHGSQEDERLLLSLLKPKFFVPVHGEYRHLTLHARLAGQTGIDPDNIMIIENGDVVELDESTMSHDSTVPAGLVYVDGLGVGDVGDVVLRDRKLLSQDGVVMVSVMVDAQTGQPLNDPDIVSRGFVYEREAGDLLSAAREHVRATLEEHHAGGAGWSFYNNLIKEDLSAFLYEQTHRRPIIFPVVMEV
jgi:ribonuclease J